jgi:thymidylate synthase ThyX
MAEVRKKFKKKFEKKFEKKFAKKVRKYYKLLEGGEGREASTSLMAAGQKFNLLSVSKAS